MRNATEKAAALLVDVCACVCVPPQCPAKTIPSGTEKGTESKTAALVPSRFSFIEEFLSRDLRVDGRNLAVTSDKDSNGVVRRLLRPGGSGGGSSGGDGGGNDSSSTRGYVAAASMTLL